MSQMVNEPLLTYAEAARYVGCTRQYIYELVIKGKISTVTINRRRYVTLNGAKAIMSRRLTHAITHLQYFHQYRIYRKVKNLVRKNQFISSSLELLDCQLAIMLLNDAERENIREVVGELLDTAIVAARSPNFDIDQPIYKEEFTHASS